MTDRPKVVILGCGFAGLGACNSLRGSGAEVTILDKNDYHTFQPLLYQVATAALEPEVVAHSIRDLVRSDPNFRFHQTTVTGIDLSKRLVEAEGLPPVPYDYLVMALGAKVNFFGVEGAAEHAFPLYTLQDAVRLKKHVLESFEAADKNPKLVGEGSLNVVVIGGGPTGVETAGAMAELFQMDFEKDYPNLPVGHAKIVLVDGGDAVLRPFKEELQEYAKESLEKRGVEVRLGEHVTSVGPESVTLQSGAEIRSPTVIWAGGLHANPLASLLDVELVRGGRVPVNSDLRLEAHPEVFVIGDVAAAKDEKKDQVLPQLGAVALQAGKHAGKNIIQLVANKPTSPFQYHDKGFMATIGHRSAVAQMPFGLTMKGSAAWLAWGTVHLALLTGWENRVEATVDWFWNLYRREHSERIDIDD